MIFYDHSTGHGAFAKDALLASNANKNPDWNGKIAQMRDGWFYDQSSQARKVQPMQFRQGDRLVRDLLCPPGIDPHAQGPAAAPAATAGPPPQAPPQPPPSAAETESAFKLFYLGAAQTLKRNHPGKSAAELRAMGKAKWADLPAARHQVYVDRVRSKAAAAEKPAAERLIAAGNPVPAALWGHHKGTEMILAERGLYPDAGLKGACQNLSAHSDANDCCCVKLLSSQLDFASECSALQHVVEHRVDLGMRMGKQVTATRHICLFLPKFHCAIGLRDFGALRRTLRARTASTRSQDYAR